MVYAHSEVHAHARCWSSITSVMPSINLQQLLLTFKKNIIPAILVEESWKHDQISRSYKMLRYCRCWYLIPSVPLCCSYITEVSSGWNGLFIALKKAQKAQSEIDDVH